MPSDSYEELLTPMNEGAVGGVENKDVEYDGKNMEAIMALLEFLDNRLDQVNFLFFVGLLHWLILFLFSLELID